MTDKKARQFDLDQMFVQSIQGAKERAVKNAANTPDDLSNDTVTLKCTDEEENEDFIGPVIPDVIGTASTSKEKAENELGNDNDEYSDEDEDIEELIESLIPVSHEAHIEHGKKPISAIACDRNGARFVTGGYDYDVKLWDFGGMDAGLRSFRTLQPCECHVIKSLSYNYSGEQMLVVAGNNQAKVLDRDGKELVECMRGDMYLVDPASTKGHTASLNGGLFHPFTRDEFLTCSQDGTVRLWNIESAKRKHHAIIKTKNRQGRRTTPTACGYSRDGKYVAAGCDDGSIQLWQHGKTYVNTAFLCRDAHASGPDITCLSFSYDNINILSRSADDTMKLWDLRNFKQPLNTKDGLETFFSMTDCIFSPRDEFCITGTSAPKNKGNGRLVFLHKNTFEVIKEIDFIDKSVVRLLWHPRINQLFATLSDGSLRLYYDPQISNRGALLCIKKPAKRQKHVDVVAEPFIIAPAALPPRKVGLDGFVKETYTLRQMLRHVRLAQRPPGMKQRTPETPISGPGAGGRVGAAGGTLHSYVARQMGMAHKPPDDEDPREALLRHAEAAEKDPYWVTPAYKMNQPKTILAQRVEEEEAEEELQPVFKKPKTST